MAGWFGKIGCFVGAHAWSDAEYERADSCRKVQKCKRCNITKIVEATTETHQWAEWQYENDHTCQQVRICQRCHQTETRSAAHQWGVWQYATEDACLQERRCGRCDAREKGEVVHVWDEWRYTEPTASEEPNRIVAHLFQLLDTSFNDAELRDVVATLGLDYDDLPGREQRSKARELTLFMARRHELSRLVREMQTHRPDLRWGALDVAAIATGALDDQLAAPPDDLTPLLRTCDQQRRCTHCGQTEQRTDHQWGEWEYETPDTCQQIMRCRRCAAVQYQPQLTHLWSEWTYTANGDSCAPMHRCQRCGQEENGKLIDHAWGAWQYDSPTACTQTSRCERCGAPQQRIEHNWNPWTFAISNSCQQTRSCRRCQAVEEKPEPQHDWSIWRYTAAAEGCVPERTCQRCAQKEQRSAEAHQWAAWQPDVEDARRQQHKCKRCQFVERRLAPVASDLAQKSAPKPLVSKDKKPPVAPQGGKSHLQ